MNSVLVVDDEAAMRHLMMRWVEFTGHHASLAASADEALVDYLVKPFGRERLRFALERGFDWHQVTAGRRQWVRRCSRLKIFLIPRLSDPLGKPENRV